MAALVAATQDHPRGKEIMGGRDKPGHDGLFCLFMLMNVFSRVAKDPIRPSP
jgi:hypothetical protein